MEATMRIGELGRRTGVSPDLLRAWERRYGVIQPTRSSGRFRLYTEADEARVRRMTELIATGLSAAEAARTAGAAPTLAAAGADAAPVVDELAQRLRTALDSYSSSEAHAVFDRLLATVSVEVLLSEVLIPYLQELGERWRRGEASIGQEHFASNLLRGRLLGLARDWGMTGSSSAVLACLPGESHDLGLVMLGLLMSRRGWRITFLGADTPFETVRSVAALLRPSLVVLCTLDPDAFERHAEDIARLVDQGLTVAVAAPVPTEAITGRGARPLPGDIVGAAAGITG